MNVPVFHVGKIVRELRKSHGLNQTQAAKKAGLDKNTWSKFERLGKNFDEETLSKIASALGVTVASLYALENEQAVRIRTEIVARLDDHKDVAGAIEPQYPSASSPRAEMVPEGGIEMADSPEWLELRTCFDRLSSKARSELLRQAHILAAEAHTTSPPNQHRGGLEAHHRKKTGRR